LAKYVAIERRR